MTLVQLDLLMVVLLEENEYLVEQLKRLLTADR